MTSPERPVTRASKSRRLIWVAPGILLALTSCGGGGGDSAEAEAPEPSAVETEAPPTEPPATEAPTTKASPAPEDVCDEGSILIKGEDQQRCDNGEWVDYVPTTTAAPTTTEETTTTAAPTTTTIPPTTTTDPPVVPLIFDGSGNDVIDLGAMVKDVRIVRATFDGDSYTSVSALDDKLEEKDMVVNEVAPVTGTYILNLYDDDESRYLKVEAGGAWHIEVHDLLDARKWNRKHVAGSGNDVLVYRNKGGILDYQFNTDSYTSVDFYGDSTEMLVNDYNDSGLLEGTTAIPAGIGVVVVDTDGDWSMTIR